MKKYRHIVRYQLLIILLLVSAAISACGKEEPVSVQQSAHPFFTSTDSVAAKSPVLTIAVSTDLHIDPDSKNKPGVSALYEYNTEFADAMLWDVRQQGADMLLLSGDITNSSRPEQHETVSGLLHKAGEKGLTIYAINGNHDIGRINTDQFAEYYKDFGYDAAYSRDDNSLSYSIRLPGRLLMMVDTGGFRATNLSGDISEATLEWVEQQLQEAQQLELPVLVVGHYPVLAQQSGSFIGGAEFKELLLKYNVPLYICGHMHGRSVATQEHLTELVVEQIISYPCSYALIRIYDTGEISFEPKMVDVEGWARENGKEETMFLEFNSYREVILRKQCRQLIDIFRESRTVSDSQASQAEEFYFQFHRDLSLGILAGETESLKKLTGYSVFMYLAKDTVYERWVPQCLDNAKPYLKGFVIPNLDDHTEK